MAQSISSRIASALSSFSKRLDSQPTFREAVVTATEPLMVQFDTDSSPSPALCSLDISLSRGDRVLTMTMNNFLWVLGRKNGNAGSPGTFGWTAAPKAPSGGLLCNGQAVSRVDYARLFNEIGVVYGNGDGTTTFNVPNAQGRTLVHLSPSGQFSPLGAVPGAENVSLTVAQLAAHNHGGSTGGNSISASTQFTLATSNPASAATMARGSATGAADRAVASSAHAHTIPSAGNGDPHNNVQPSFVANLFIWT